MPRIASDRLVDFTVELSAIEMEPLVPRAGSTAADLRPMSVDTDAVSSSSEKVQQRHGKVGDEDRDGAGGGGRARNVHRCARGESRMREEIVDSPAPQIQGQIHEIGKVIPQERVSERVVKQTVNIPVPQIMDETVEAIQLVPEEQTPKYIVE